MATATTNNNCTLKCSINSCIVRLERQCRISNLPKPDPIAPRSRIMKILANKYSHCAFITNHNNFHSENTKRLNITSELHQSTIKKYEFPVKLQNDSFRKQLKPDNNALQENSVGSKWQRNTEDFLWYIFCSTSTKSALGMPVSQIKSYHNATC